MEFYISKILWAVAAPSHLLIVLLALCLFLPTSYTTKVFSSGFIALLLLIAMMFPVGDWALVPLEMCGGHPQLPPQVDGAIALGGALENGPSIATGEAQFNTGVGRFLGLMKIAKTYPQAIIVYSGGPGSPKFLDFKEADYVKRAWVDAGEDPNRFVAENQSRNTIENAEDSKPIFGKTPGQNWLVVTSAYHMARALTLFRRAGADSHTNFYAYPVDFKTPGRFQFEFTFDLPGNLGKLDAAAKEYAGLLYNRLLGRTKHFMPCAEEKETLQ